MACDLSDPTIASTYAEIIGGHPTNWMLLGYHDTRDKISVYSSGVNGLEGLRDALSDEVLYGLVRLDGLDPPQNVLVTYVSEQVSGVRRARALVHGRAVAAALKDHHLQVSASSTGDLSDQAIAYKLANGATPPASRGLTTPPADEGGASPATPAASIPERVLAAEPVVVATPPPEAERPIPQGPSPEEIEADRARRAAEAHAQRKAELEARLTAKRQAKEEEERLRKEAVREKLLTVQRQGRDGALQGYLTVQGQDNYLWQRRWYVLKDGTLALYRDDADPSPVATIPLASVVKGVSDAQREVLIPHSFRVDPKSGNPWYFFADDIEAKDTAMAAIAACK